MRSDRLNHMIIRSWKYLEKMYLLTAMVIQSDGLQNICSNRDRKCDNNTGAVPDYGERLFLLYRKVCLIK